MCDASTNDAVLIVHQWLTWQEGKNFLMSHSVQCVGKKLIKDYTCLKKHLVNLSHCPLDYCNSFLPCIPSFTPSMELDPKLPTCSSFKTEERSLYHIKPLLHSHYKLLAAHFCQNLLETASVTLHSKNKMLLSSSDIGLFQDPLTKWLHAGLLMH